MMSVIHRCLPSPQVRRQDVAMSRTDAGGYHRENGAHPVGRECRERRDRRTGGKAESSGDVQKSDVERRAPVPAVNRPDCD